MQEEGAGARGCKRVQEEGVGVCMDVSAGCVWEHLARARARMSSGLCAHSSSSSRERERGARQLTSPIRGPCASMRALHVDSA